MRWVSSDENILTVNSRGVVTGVNPGTAIVTVYGMNADGTTISAEKEIKVNAATTATGDAKFYYLKTPTSDPASNATDQWGESLGTGKINTTGVEWDDNNTYDNVANRVILWPDGSTGTSFTVPNKGVYATHWKAIYNAFKVSVETELGAQIAEGDVEAIILHPYKISYNRGDNHVDCTVEIKVKNIYTATYYLQDAGESGYQWKEANNYRTGAKTNPSKEYPATKIVNGVTYTFVGWYDNQSLSGAQVEFPYTIQNSNVNFYAKYIAGYNVTYDLAGGSWNIEDTYFKKRK